MLLTVLENKEVFNQATDDTEDILYEFMDNLKDILCKFLPKDLYIIKNLDLSFYPINANTLMTETYLKVAGIKKGEVKVLKFEFTSTLSRKDFWYWDSKLSYVELEENPEISSDYIVTIEFTESDLRSTKASWEASNGTYFQTSLLDKLSFTHVQVKDAFEKSLKLMNKNISIHWRLTPKGIIVLPVGTSKLDAYNVVNVTEYLIFYKMKKATKKDMLTYIYKMINNK